MNKIKRLVAMMLAVIMSVTVLPQTQIQIKAATGTASLVNIGQLGTVNIGDKSESGTWLKTLVNNKPVFCLDLGKACHTGDVYVSSTSEISSDSTNAKTAALPCFGAGGGFVFYAGDLIVVLFKIVHGTYQPGIVLQGGRF